MRLILTAPAIRFAVLVLPIVMAGWLPAVQAQTAATQNLDEVSRQVQDYLRATLETLRGPDGEAPDLQVGAPKQAELAACSDITPFLPPGARLRTSMNIGVRCNGPKAWTTYFPVTIRMNVSYLVAARGIASDQAIGRDDVTARMVDFSRLPPNVARDPDSVVGLVAGNRIGPGQPIKTAGLRSSDAVLRGQRVRITATGPGFSVTSEGQALATAAPGAPVQVRTASGQTITGTVRSAGLVEVSL